MQIPPLIKTLIERMADVPVMNLPGVVNGHAILRDLLAGKQRAAMRRDRQDVGGAVGDTDARSGEMKLHHGAREIARRVEHVLVGRGDAEARGVIVSAEMSGGDAAARGFHQLRQNEKRLRSFDHQLHADGGEAVELGEQRRHLLHHRDLGQGDYEVCGQESAGAIEKSLQKKAQRADGAGFEFFIERLDADAEKGGSAETCMARATSAAA